MVMEFYIIKMVINMKDNSKMMKLVVKDLNFIKMEIVLTEILKIIKCRDKGFLNGIMEINILVNGKKI
jgi:hypothetical protein